MTNAELKLEWAQRLINIVCGETWGDGEVVTDVGMGYSEPGYHNDNTVWVLGNWNTRTVYDRLRRPHKDETPSRLFDALERIGVEGEWLDEWAKCSHCYKIVRTSPDSYMWKPFYVWVADDSEILCGNCALDDEWFDDVLKPHVNNAENCVTFCDKSHLESNGWERYNDRRYQSGMHPGMNDTPVAIAQEIARDKPGYDFVFYLDEQSQFYIEFSVFIKAREQEDDEDA